MRPAAERARSVTFGPRPRWPLAGLALVTAIGACGRYSTRRGDVGDSTFVAVMADLRRAVQPGGAETTRDSAGRAAVRDSILRKYGVTRAVLERTASHLADDIGHADQVGRAIDHKVLTLNPVIPTPPATPAAATPRPVVAPAPLAATPGGTPQVRAAKPPVMPAPQSGSKAGMKPATTPAINALVPPGQASLRGTTHVVVPHDSGSARH